MARKRSLISCQLPSSLSPRTRSSLSHPSPQRGPKGDSPKEPGSEQFASTLQPSRPNNPTVPLSASLSAPQDAKKRYGEAITLPFKKTERISKVATLMMLCAKVAAALVPWCIWWFILLPVPRAQHQTSASALNMNVQPDVLLLHTPTVQSIHQLEHGTFHTQRSTSVVFKRVWKNTRALAAARHVRACHESKPTVVFQAPVTGSCIENRAVSRAVRSEMWKQ